MVGHFAFSVLTLILPTICMGATLPVLALAIRRGADTSGLYGANTLGAAAGSVLASFVLIYNFGCLTSAAIIAGLNVAIFAVCWAISRLDSVSVPAHESDDVVAASDATTAVVWNSRDVRLLAFFSGFTFFGFELVWNRCLGLLLGNRVYVTSVTLGLVLLCLAIGTRIGRIAMLRGRSTLRTVGEAYVVAAGATSCALAVAPMALRGSTPEAMLTFVVLLVVVPATMLGVGFPLLLALPVRPGERASHVGALYALNTLGSVLGTLLVGYFLLEILGSGRLLVVMAMLLLGCASLIWLSSIAISKGWCAAAALIAAASIFQWNARITTVDPSKALVLEEDRHGVFSISPVESGCLSVRCDATELVFRYGHPMTQYVQESQAHVPLAFAPVRRRVVVIGSGYGITAGAFGTYADVESVDAVEILPLLVTHANYFVPGNHSYHLHPRVRVHVTDGRHFLAVAREPYDIISINVSDPYLPGSSSLFSHEFYALVARKLSPGGIVAQHVFGPDSASLLAGFRRHFPYVQAVRGYANSLTLIGGKVAIAPYRAAEFDTNEVAQRSLAGVGRARTSLAQLLLEGSRSLERLETQRPAFENSDVFPALEFRRSAELDTFFSNR